MPVLLNRPEYGAAYVTPCFQGAETERMVVVCCDARLQPKHAETVAVGDASAVAVTPADILTPVIRHRAASFFIAHNHPSGDPTPSDDDIILTRAVFRAAEVMGLRFMDHLVIAAGSHASIRELLTEHANGWNGGEKGGQGG